MKKERGLVQQIAVTQQAEGGSRYSIVVLVVKAVVEA